MSYPGPRGESAKAALVRVVRSGLAAGLAAFALSGCGGVAVPDVVGDSESDATKELVAAELKAARTTASSTDWDKGVVIDSDPGVGVEVDAGTTVTLTVSSGPPYTITALVPDASDLPSATEVSAPESFDGAEKDGSASYPVDECWPRGFGSGVSETATSIMAEGGDMISTTVHDMSTPARARAALRSVVGAQQGCSTGTQPVPKFVGNIAAAMWRQTMTVAGVPAITTVSVITGAGSPTTAQGVRVTFAEGKYLVHVNVSNPAASYAVATDPTSVDPGQEAIAERLIDLEKEKIRTLGVDATASPASSGTTSTTSSSSSAAVTAAMNWLENAPDTPKYPAGQVRSFVSGDLEMTPSTASVACERAGADGSTVVLVGTKAVPMGSGDDPNPPLDYPELQFFLDRDSSIFLIEGPNFYWSPQSEQPPVPSSLRSLCP